MPDDNFSQFDVIVIGGGAAGLFCGAQAGRRGRRTLIIEHNAQVGRKIIISGGGRCNFTNIHTTAENFVSQNPHFAKSALAQYSPQDFLGLVSKHKIACYEKKLGQMFCRESSRQIVEMLVGECRAAGVRIMTNCSVTNVAAGGTFVIETSRGRFQSKKLVVACGGLSFPKIGASDLGYRLAKQFGLNIVPTRPSLVGLVFDGESQRALAGVSIDAEVESGAATFRENILFTHRGLSGPAILQASNYWRRGIAMSIDLLPDTDLAADLRQVMGSGTVAGYLQRRLPQRFVKSFADRIYADKATAQLSEREIESIADAINNWQVRFEGTEGWDRAEVTLGGVSTDELSSKTMEAKRVPGLYFIGEVVDVTGWLGGYNFQWAWASAFAAGNAI